MSRIDLTGAAPTGPAEAPLRGAGEPPVARPHFRTAWWSDFAELFRAFRMAIHPANIIAIVAALIMLYAAGWAFDAVWGRQVAPQEIAQYQVDRPRVYQKTMRAWLDHRPRRLRGLLEDAQVNATPAQITALSENPDAAFNRLRVHDENRYHAKIAALAARTNREITHKILPFRPAMQQERQEDRHATATLARRLVQARAVAGRPVFYSFVNYERDQFHMLVANTLGILRLGNVRASGMGMAPAQGAPAALTMGLFPHHPRRVAATPTVAGNLINMFYTGPAWLVTAAAPMRTRLGDTGSHVFLRRLAYLLSLLLLVALFLALASIVGGAVCRHAACQAGGVETSFLDCLNMARRAWLALVQAWLTPFAALLVLALGLALVALVGAIPAVGPIFVGLFLILFFAGGFVLMLIILGVLGGFHLLFPAIAVEGPDSFDAVSRAFSFLFARPWRMLCYVILAIFYGVLTYLFVGFALFVVLYATHIAVGWGMGLFGAGGSTQLGVSHLNTIWPVPHFSRYLTPVNWAALSWPQAIAAILVRWWAYLVAMSLAAYVISYYFTSSTIMYLLLRRVVDGQDFSELAPDDAFLPPRRTSTAEAPGPVVGPAAPVAGVAASAAPTTAGPPRFTELTVNAPTTATGKSEAGTSAGGAEPDADSGAQTTAATGAETRNDVVIVTPDSPPPNAAVTESADTQTTPAAEPFPPSAPEGPPQ